MGGTDWVPGLIALGIGLLGGLLLALRARRSSARTSAPEIPAPTPEARDLLAERDLLLGRLKEMAGAGDEASARERYRLELEAGRVLLELDRVTPASPAPAAQPAAPATGLTGWMHAHPVAQGIIWGATGTAAVLGLVFWVMTEAKDRAPGGSATGNAQSAAMGAGQDQAPDAELKEVVDFARAHPDSVDAQLDLAEAYLQHDQPAQAYEATQKILAKDPDNPRALTYGGVVRSAMGEGDEAMKMLDRAVERDPNLAEAWVHRGLVASEIGQYQVAVDSWEKALKLRPDGESLIRPALEKVKALAQQKAAGTGPFAKGMPADHPRGGAMPAGMGDPGNLPPGHPAIGGGTPPVGGGAPMMGEGAPAATTGGGVHGTLELDPSLAGKVAPGATIFLSARPDGVTSGPPSAARRLEAGSFPMTFSLGPQDSMMGMPWPEKATIEARVDSDGNAMTHDPSDPVARQTGVTAGTELKLTLRGP